MRFSIILFFFYSLSAFAQTGINTTTVHSKAELQVVSPGNDKGVLIPRMLTADIAGIASPATGLVVYTIDNNTFYYYTGVKWKRIGEDCSIVEDNDTDTKVEVDNGADNDIVAFSANGTTIVSVDKDGLRQSVGDLVKTNGTITVNNDYTLPIADGNANDVMVTDGAGNLTWKNPLTLPGLIAGVQSIPLVTGREWATLGDKTWLTAIIPWSDITIENISFYINVVGSPTIEVGIYDDVTLLGSNTVTFSSTGYQFGTVTMASGVQLTAGKMYRVAVVDQYESGSEFLENPNYSSNIHWKTLNGPTPEILPATIPSYTEGQKPVWFCLY